MATVKGQVAGSRPAGGYSTTSRATDATTGQPVNPNVLRLANGFTRVRDDPTLNSPAARARRARSTTGRRGAGTRTTSDPALASRPRTIIPTVGAL